MRKQLKWIEPTEKEIENAILYYLSYQVGCFAFKVNTMGVFDQRGGFYRKVSKFVKPGTPDILCCYFGLFLGFEVKSPTGRQSKEQKVFEEQLKEKANGLYFLVRSVKEVEDTLKAVKARIFAQVEAFEKVVEGFRIRE